MRLDTLVYVGFGFNLAVFLFGMALCVIALWQNRLARPNQYLALTSLGFGLWAIPNGLYYAIESFDLQPEPVVAIASGGYTLAFLALFYFVTELDTPQDRQIAHQTRWIAIVWAVIVLAIIGSYRFWSEPVANDANLYEYHVSILGGIVFLAVAISLIYVGERLRHSTLANHIDLLVALAPLLIGLFFFAVLGAPYGHLVNSITVLVSLVLVARITLHDQLFNPLLELYNELSVRNKQLELAGRRKSEFLANMSHELRTPLNSIIGYTELILNGVYGEPTDQQADRLEKVLRNGRDLLDLINDVLDLSKIDAGRLDLDPVRVPTNALVDATIATVESLAAEKNLDLIRQYQDLPMLYVDEMRARQAILNVLANLIRFTVNDHSVTIAGYFDAIGHQVVLTLHTSSGGLTKPDTVKITQALVDNDSLPAEQFADFGLGLAVSKRLVELHGGRLWLEESQNAFYISLPAAANLDTGDVQIASVTSEQDTRPLVLVIDDDVDTIEVLQGYLEPAGYRMFGAQSGHEGILRARELRPRLITLDIQMPGLDGWGVLDILKSDETLNLIPVIIISVTDQSHMIGSVYPQVQALTKPINRHSFLNTLERAMASSPAVLIDSVERA
jgi:signal transduction histidine kinase/CheY-like chemotaxis protein